MPPGPDLGLSHSFNDALSVTHGGIRFRASQRLHHLLNCSLLRLTTSSVAVRPIQATFQRFTLRTRSFRTVLVAPVRELKALTWFAGVAHDMLDFLQEFMAAHPEVAKNDFYITGESYAGHYVPAVSQRVWQHNKAASGPPIALKGFAIGAHDRPPLRRRSNSMLQHCSGLDAHADMHVPPRLDHSSLTCACCVPLRLNDTCGRWPLGSGVMPGLLFFFWFFAGVAVKMGHGYGGVPSGSFGSSESEPGFRVRHTSILVCHARPPPARSWCLTAAGRLHEGRTTPEGSESMLEGSTAFSCRGLCQPTPPRLSASHPWHTLPSCFPQVTHGPWHTLPSDQGSPADQISMLRDAYESRHGQSTSLST